MTNNVAWAVVVMEENFDVILSEAGRKFNREHIENWLYEHGEGYFLRDELSALDCSLFVPLVFEELYTFRYPLDTAMFKEVIPVKK